MAEKIAKRLNFDNINKVYTFESKKFGAIYLIFSFEGKPLYYYSITRCAMPDSEIFGNYEIVDISEKNIDTKILDKLYFNEILKMKNYQDYVSEI